MVDYTPEYAPIVQRAINAYNGLIELYAQDEASNPYFKHCLAEAQTKRNGLQERLVNTVYLADAFRDNFFQSIDHFLDSHRGEYGFDMPNPNPDKALVAGNYLDELRSVMEDMIRIQRAQRVSKQ